MTGLRHVMQRQLLREIIDVLWQITRDLLYTGARAVRGNSPRGAVEWEDGSFGNTRRKRHRPVVCRHRHRARLIAGVQMQIAGVHRVTLALVSDQLSNRAHSAKNR